MINICVEIICSFAVRIEASWTEANDHANFGHKKERIFFSAAGARMEAVEIPRSLTSR